MFSSRNKKNNVYPCKSQFYYIKVGFQGVKIIWACFRDVISVHSLSVYKLSRLASVAQSDACPTGDKEVAGSIPAGSGNILLWRLIMK